MTSNVPEELIPMQRITYVSVFIALGLVLLAAACSSLSTGIEAPTTDAIIAYVSSVTDGFTSEEADQVRAMIDQHATASNSVDWGVLGGTVLTSVAGALGLARFLPNSLLIGRQESDALNKAAGLS